MQMVGFQLVRLSFISLPESYHYRSMVHSLCKLRRKATNTERDVTYRDRFCMLRRISSKNNTASLKLMGKGEVMIMVSDLVVLLDILQTNVMYLFHCKAFSN